MKRTVAAAARGAFNVAMFLFGVGLVVTFAHDAIHLKTVGMRILFGVFAVVLAAALVVAVRNIALDARDRHHARQRA